MGSQPFSDHVSLHNATDEHAPLYQFKR